MRKHTILNSIPIGADDRAITVQIENTTVKVLWYVTSEGMSRHYNKVNLDKCLCGKLSFKDDAVFFYKSKAIPMAKSLMNCYTISIGDVEFLKNKIESWEE